MKTIGYQQGTTIWMTGLSGAGKSTLTEALKNYLEDELDMKTIVLDGDVIRKGICEGLGFSL
jgi:adenylylsulfate kinase